MLDKVDNNPDSVLIYVTQPESFSDHKHEKGQLTFFEGGSAHLYSEDSNYFIPTHHFAWIPPKLTHRFVHYKKENIVVRTFYIPAEFSQHEIFQEIGIFHANPLMIEVFKSFSTGEIFPSEKPYDFFTTFIQFLPSLLPNKLTLFLPVSSHEIVRKIQEYLLSNLSDSLHLKDTAKAFNLGEKTFSRLFSHEVGLTYYQYVKNARIMKSIELILEDKLSISEIAYEVGYGSIAAFSNAFYNLTNKRPTDYKT